MSQPQITCAILCYNYGRFLARAIDSCLAQTLSPEKFEVLVIDDGSTDDTPEVCARYAGRIRVSRSTNLGFSASLQRGVAEARGQYVCYLDADDWWHSGKLAQVSREVAAGALFVMHPMTHVDEKGATTGSVGACGNTSSICVHREAALTLLPAMTELFCHPLFEAGYGVRLVEPLGYYRIHGRAMTDRSGRVASTQTAFFARTNHKVANRLRELSVEPPFWERSSAKLRKLARKYEAEACWKDFERLTELRERGKLPSAFLHAISRWLLSGRRLEKRHARLTVRMIGILVGII